MQNGGISAVPNHHFPHPVLQPCHPTQAGDGPSARRHPQLAFHTMDVLSSPSGGSGGSSGGAHGGTNPTSEAADAGAAASGAVGKGNPLAGAASMERPASDAPADLSAGVVFLYHLVPGGILV